MARIAVIVSNPCVSDARVIKMAQAAADAGHEVHVFGTLAAETPPFDNSGSVSYHRLDWRPVQVLMGVFPLNLLSHRFVKPVGTFIAKRLVAYAKYAMFSRVFAKHVAAIKPDIIHAHDLICLQAAHDAAEECGAEVVYDAHELEVHRNPPHPFLQKRWVAHVEKKYGQRAAAVNTVGRKVGEVLARHLGRSDINILYNSPIINPCERHIRGEIGIGPEVPLFIYVGKVTMGRGVSEILPLLPKLEGVVFATVGPCDARTHTMLLRQADKLEVGKRFRMMLPVPFDQVVDYIRGADIGIISVEPVTLSYQYCMPNKLFEMSFADVPIVSNELDEIKEFLAENGNGEIVDFEDKTSLAYTISRMLRENDRLKMRSGGLAALDEKYSWRAQVDKLNRIYGDILARRPREVPQPDGRGV